MLNGQVALVTGATRGIGSAILLAIARSGAIAIGTATTAAGAERITSVLADLGVAGKGVVLDVTDAAVCDALLDSVTKEFGPITILVNNAGITRDNLSMRMKDEEFESVIATNLSSVFRLSRGVMRGMMKARQGRIVNVTSVVGHTGNAGQANYCAAKAGLAGLTRSLARELGSRSITVNSVAPGFIDTDMTKSLDEKHREAMLSSIPLGRLGNPGDVAGAVLFLVSPAAAYITGSTIHVNGGMFME
jgi:3-oxoacyl-[acyl-carrier protein] reductase